MTDLAAQLLDWIAIPSVTGAEGDYGDALARELGSLGLDVERQQLAPGRFNVLARAGRPELVLCTHLDTVPPYIGPSADAHFVHGRGACDAKGQAVCQIEALRRLLRQGERRVGLLFTVGEETDSAGAALADARLAEPWRPRHVVIGEPTDGRYVRGHKGVFRCRLAARGVAGHSSQDVGPSAVHELVTSLARLLASEWGELEHLGRGTLNVGRMEGGLAANVVAPSASADLLLRIVEDPRAVEERLRAALGEHVSLEPGFKAYGPVHFHVPERAAEPPIAVAFGTDAPYLPHWGKPVLFGPGSIRDAHTEHERIAKKDLEAAAGELVLLAHELLDGGAHAQR